MHTLCYIFHQSQRIHSHGTVLHVSKLYKWDHITSSLSFISCLTSGKLLISVSSLKNRDNTTFSLIGLFWGLNKLNIQYRKDLEKYLAHRKQCKWVLGIIIKIYKRTCDSVYLYAHTYADSEKMIKMTRKIHDRYFPNCIRIKNAYEVQGGKAH